MSDPKDIPEQVEVMKRLYAPVDDFESWWREYDGGCKSDAQGVADTSTSGRESSRTR